MITNVLTTIVANVLANILTMTECNLVCSFYFNVVAK